MKLTESDAPSTSVVLLPSRYPKTIPQTIVIGKDGIVQKVFAGESPGREEAIEDAIRKAREK